MDTVNFLIWCVFAFAITTWVFVTIALALYYLFAPLVSARYDLPE